MSDGGIGTAVKNSLEVVIEQVRLGWWTRWLHLHARLSSYGDRDGIKTKCGDNRLDGEQGGNTSMLVFLAVRIAQGVKQKLPTAESHPETVIPTAESHPETVISASMDFLIITADPQSYAKVLCPRVIFYC